MKPLAFFAIDHFAAARAIVAARDVILAETRTLADDEFVDWPARSAYSSGWQLFGLRIPRPPAGLAIDFERNRRRLPRTAELLLSLPAAQLIGISRLLPGCHIFPHSDDPQPHVLRFHMGLRVAATSGMRVQGQIVQWQQGEAFVFDHSIQHEAANLGSEPRDVLLVDLRLSPDEQRCVAELRAAAAARTN